MEYSGFTVMLKRLIDNRIIDSRCFSNNQLRKIIIGYNQTQEFSTFHVNYDCFAEKFSVNLHIFMILHAKIANCLEQIIIDNRSVGVNRLSIMIFRQILSTTLQYV